MDDRKFLQIDALRFFAVLLVLFGHWLWFGYDFFDKLNSGSRGVDLFFVISGFLITLGLLRAKKTHQTPINALGRFYVRRFLRIFPAYYLFLLLVWLFNHSRVADGILWYLLYAGNFYIIKTQSFGGIGHLWSLSVEEQFYLVWPFLILFIPDKRLPMVMMLALLISMTAKVYWYVSGVTFWTPYMNPLGCLDILSMGAMLAYAYRFHQDTLRRFLQLKLVVAIIVLQLIVCLICKYNIRSYWVYDTFMRTSWGLCCTWLVGKATFGFDGIAGRILEWRPLTYIGQISYGIYLYQVLVPGMMMGLKYPEDGILSFLLYFAGTIGIASASWYLFEKPILGLKKNFE